MRQSNRISVIAVVLVAVALCIVASISIYNRLVVLEEGVKSAWAQVETVLQRRADLIPNLVESVKGYATHEEKVLTEVTQARASVASAGSPDEKIAANSTLSSALARLLVVVERYPDLKANQNFLALQDELAGTENRIAVERRRYNEAAQRLNRIRRKIPYRFFAGVVKEAPYFKAEKDVEKAPKVEF